MPPLDEAREVPGCHLGSQATVDGQPAFTRSFREAATASASTTLQRVKVQGGWANSRVRVQGNPLYKHPLLLRTLRELLNPAGRNPVDARRDTESVLHPFQFIEGGDKPEVPRRQGFTVCLSCLRRTTIKPNRTT